MHTHVWGRREDFTLYGSGSISPTLGPGRSVYLAQPLANKGIAVLQVGPPPPGSPTHPFDEATVRMHGSEAAIDDLCSAGLVDRHRVGSKGHRGAGGHVEYARAFSPFRFSAQTARAKKNS